MTPDDIKSVGIIGGLIVSSIALFLNFFSTLRNIKTQKISNYQEIVKSHREIWKLTIDNPNSFERIFESNVDLRSKPITYQESLFVRLLFLHMSSAYSFAKYSHMLQIEKLEMDFSEILTFPIPRLVWNENSKYHNEDFSRFLELSGKSKGLLEKIKSMFSNNALNYSKPWKVLILSVYSDRIINTIEKLGDSVVCKTDTDGEITKSYIKNENIDYIICFGYGNIIKPEVIKEVTCINVHVGYLPYNRGPNPNLWAWIDDTPKGVTLHYIDKGVDTGDIICQQEISSFENPTLQSAYDKHVDVAVDMLDKCWPKIRSGTSDRKKQQGIGSSHTLKDQECLDELFDVGMDIPITEFCSKAKELINMSNKSV